MLIKYTKRIQQIFIDKLNTLYGFTAAEQVRSINRVCLVQWQD